MKIDYTIGNVCFLFDTLKRKVLLLKRNKEPMSSLFTGVGGKINIHEDAMSSCIREISEETGFCVSKLKLRGIIKTILLNHNSGWIIYIYMKVFLKKKNLLIVMKVT